MSSKNLKQKLSKVINRLKFYNPDKVIVFGSVASGRFNKYSDIDLLIIKKTKKPPSERIDEIQKYLYQTDEYGTDKFIGPLDPLIYTPEEISKELDIGDFFIQEIFQQGKIIYEKTRKRKTISPLV